jgi:hypothetical protein
MSGPRTPDTPVMRSRAIDDHLLLLRHVETCAPNLTDFERDRAELHSRATRTPQARHIARRGAGERGAAEGLIEREP